MATKGAEDHNAETQTSCARCTSGYTRIILGIQSKLNHFCGNIGGFAARRPILLTVLSICLAAACAGGWARFRIESDGDKLWVPQHSKAMKDENWVSSTFVNGGGGAQFLATVHSSQSVMYGINALQLGVFWEMFVVDSAVRAITVDNGGRTYKWEDVCEVNYNYTCKYSGPLNLWSMSFDSYLADVGGSRTDPTVGDRNALISAVNSNRFPDNSAVSTLSIFGGIVLSPLDSPPPGSPPLYMSSAQVVSQGYGLRDGLDDKVMNKWFDKFLDVLEAQAARTQHSALAYIAGNSVDDEIGRSVTNDLYLIVVSIAIFVLVAVLGMSRVHGVATRSSLALLGVVSALLAMVAGYGLSMLFGCPFTTLSQTLPYILLGLSIDCMFILTKAYDGLVAADPAAPLEERFRRLMSSAGTSVTVTLLASAVAFALGSISELPSVRWFSVYATMGVVSILVATLTFFAGVFVLTERRIARNRIDCLCCITSGGPRVPTAAQYYYSSDIAGLVPPTAAAAPGSATAHNAPYIPVGVHTGSRGAGESHFVPTAVILQATASHRAPAPMGGPSRTAGPVAESASTQGSLAHSLSASSSTVQQGNSLKKAAVPDVASIPKQDCSTKSGTTTTTTTTLPEEPNLMKMLFARYYAPFLTTWYGKVIVIAIFCGWIVLSGIGASRLEEGQPLSELAPDDSYLQDYVTVMEDTFQEQIGAPTHVYFRWLDPAAPAQQAKMLQSLATSLDNNYVNSTISAFQGNWLIDFIGWVQKDRPSVQLVAMEGCANPYVGRVSGDLGLFVHPEPIPGCVPRDQFYPLLKEFLAVSRGYNDDLLWSSSIGPGGTLLPTAVWASRMPLVHTAQGDNGAYGRKCIKSLRKLEDDINDDKYGAETESAPGDVCFLSNSDYIYYEGDALLGPMTIEYILLAVAGVGLVLTLTLPSIRAVLLMMFAVGLVDFFLFGEMFILGIRFNQVSIINMIMATGLSVDYSVYFAQRFVAVTADGTLNGRMALALSDTGSAVFVGGLTAMAGTIPLAFSTSTILRTFFALIFGTIAFALLIGLMLMPVIFSLIGPPPLPEDAGLALGAAHEGMKEKASQQLQQKAPESMPDWKAHLAAVRAEGDVQVSAIQQQHQQQAGAGPKGPESV